MKKFLSLFFGVSVLVLCLSGLLYYWVVFAPDGFILTGESLSGSGDEGEKDRLDKEPVEVSFSDYEPTNGAVSYSSGIWRVKQ